MSAMFEEIVRAWLLHYDDRLPSDRKERRKAFLILIGTLLEHGYGKEEITNSRKEKIIKFCVNPNHKNKSKLRKWVSILVNDLEAAILIHYPLIKIKEDIVTPDMCSKLDELERKSEESRLLKTSDEDDSEEATEDTFSIEDNEPLDIGKSVSNLHKDKEKEFEITNEMLDGMDAPEVTYDPDFMKKLGIE